MALTLDSLLPLGLVVVGSALSGALITLAGIWVLWATRILARLERRGQMYLADTDNERARQLAAAYDAATGMEFMRQALRRLSPEMAAEFTRPAEAGKDKQ